MKYSAEEALNAVEQCDTAEKPERTLPAPRAASTRSARSAHGAWGERPRAGAKRRARPERGIFKVFSSNAGRFFSNVRAVVKRVDRAPSVQPSIDASALPGASAAPSVQPSAAPGTKPGVSATSPKPKTKLPKGEPTSVPSSLPSPPATSPVPPQFIPLDN